MISITNIDVYGWDAAIRGMRNPMNSWSKSDTVINHKECYLSYIGDNDKQLMTKLCKAGPVHAKFRRMITVTIDVVAPLYWWKEFDTYRIGTVSNSCSTMHKIADKEFDWGDFSIEHLYCTDDVGLGEVVSMRTFEAILDALNFYRNRYIKTKDKDDWWQMIQLLPSSYNQKRTIQLNYEVLSNICRDRRGHKLDEWRQFCDIMIKNLPESWIFTGEEE